MMRGIMKIPWKIKQAWTDQIRSKKIGSGCKISPNMLITVKANRIRPASHDDIIDGIAVDDVAMNNYDETQCSYYPYHPTTLFETEVENWSLTDEDVWLFFNLSPDEWQYVNYETRWKGRQLRLENIVSEKKWEFTIRRSPYPEIWRPWVPWPIGKQGVPWIKGDKWEPSKVPWPQWIPWPKGEKWDKWEPWPKGEAFTYKDFTTDQKLLLKGDKWDKGDTWPQGIPWPKGDTGDTLDTLKRWGKRNWWVKYTPLTIVHHEWSARITIHETINNEPGRETPREIFAEWWHFLPAYQ